jgi:hypothetical protein
MIAQLKYGSGTPFYRVAWPHQHRRQRMQCLLELFVIVLAQRRLPRSVQLVQIYINTSSRGFHPRSMSSSRNCFVNGYPSTSLIDRFGA